MWRTCNEVFEGEESFDFGSLPGKMRGKDRELEVGDERRQCSSFGSRRGGGWPACTVLAREHKGQRMSLDSREQESARRWVTEEGGEAEAVGG